MCVLALQTATNAPASSIKNALTLFSIGTGRSHPYLACVMVLFFSFFSSFLLLWSFLHFSSLRIFRQWSAIFAIPFDIQRVSFFSFLVTILFTLSVYSCPVLRQLSSTVACLVFKSSLGLLPRSFSFNFHQPTPLSLASLSPHLVDFFNWFLWLFFDVFWCFTTFFYCHRYFVPTFPFFFFILGDLHSNGNCSSAIVCYQSSTSFEAL